jgi:hypothetical protein
MSLCDPFAGEVIPLARIPFPEQTGPLFDEVRAARGRISKSTALMGWSPPVLEATFRRQRLMSQGVLRHALREAVAYAVSVDNGCLR